MKNLIIVLSWFFILDIYQQLPKIYGPIESLEDCKKLAILIKTTFESNSNAWSPLELNLKDSFCFNTNTNEKVLIN